jgi:eukaryotic-like serine/threonine-protein kinase
LLHGPTYTTGQPPGQDAVQQGGNPGVFRISVTGGDAERIADLKGVHHTGYYSVWFGLDPTDAALLLRDIGTSDIYALKLEQK